MAYQVIARKWRPQTFEEVTGQEPITRTLRGAIEHERLHHAYLFSGARGVGKTTTARLLAKALNCHKSDGPTPTPCKSTDPDPCPSCREVTEGRSIDVLEIDAASNTGVDNVREAIINSVAVRPARDRFKVFIIDEVHMLSGAAFNALLKTLEEPPPRVIFIMATTESHKVPDTILSRCQQFEFRTIATPKIAERLRLIADAEQIKIDDAALREIARAGDGSMRDAQSAFDQVISFSDGQIVSADVEAALGLASAEQLARVVAAVAQEQPAEALAVVDDLVMRGHDLRNFCRDLLAHVRDLLVAKISGAGDSGRGDAASEAFSESDLVRCFHSLTETEQKLREGAHPRYQLEVGLIKLIEMRRLAPISQLIERIQALEESLRTGRAPLAGAGSNAASSGGSGAAGGGPAPRGGGGGGGRMTPPPVPHASTPRASSESPPARPPAPAATPAAVPPAPASYVAQGVSEPPPASDPFDWSSYGPPTAPTEAPFWETLAEPKTLPPASAQTVAEQPAAAANAAAPASLRLVNRPAPPAASAGGKSFAARGWRVPGRDDLPAEPPDFDAAAPTDAFTEQLKRALEDRRKPLLATALDNARKVSVEGDELYIEFAPEKKLLRDNLNKPDSMKLLRDICHELLGRDVGLRVVCKDARETDAPPTREDEALREQQALRALAEKHPNVQHLLRTFGGEIVDVRRVEPEDG